MAQVVYPSVIQRRKAMSYEERRAERDAHEEWGRTCVVCKVLKHISHYSLNVNDEHDAQTTCMECKARQDKERMAKNSDNSVVVSKEYAKACITLSEADFSRIVSVLNMDPEPVDRVICALELFFGNKGRSQNDGE